MKKGEIWFVDLLGGTGHEQFGERPAVILAPTPLDCRSPSTYRKSESLEVSICFSG